MVERGFAGSVCAPRGIRVYGGIARHVEDDRAPALSRRSCERTEHGLRQPERPDQIGGECALEILAIGVAEERQRGGPEIGGVVDEDVETAEFAKNLESDGIDGVLRGDVSDDAVGARVATLDRFDPVAAARDEGHPRAGAVQLADEREPEAGCAARDGGPQALDSARARALDPLRSGPGRGQVWSS